MFRGELKTRLLADGCVEIVDPDLECLPLMTALNRDFSIRQSPLPGFSVPRFQIARGCSSLLPKGSLAMIPDAELWCEHTRLLATVPPVGRAGHHCSGTASLLDIKIELSRRELAACTLYGRQCRVDRLKGEHGRCGLGGEAWVAELFTHIAEEPPINPSCNVGLAGCGLGCCFCQKHELLDGDACTKQLDRGLWDCIAGQTERARSVSFIGGNPDESLPAILRFLGEAPPAFDKPVIWNSNGYAMPVTYRLLEVVVDCYVPDAKFYSPRCGACLAGAPDYWERFASGVAEMVRQKVPVIVRMLVLPGHSECCHKPMITHLSGYSHQIRLNIMGQYYQDYLVNSGDMPELSRRAPQHEVRGVIDHALQYGRSWLRLTE